MRIKTFTMRFVAIVAFLSMATISALAWDEQGPTISGSKTDFVGDIKRESCTPVKEKGLWGFVDAQNKVKIKPKYEAIGTPQIVKTGKTERSYIPVKLKGKWGIVNNFGKECVKPLYDTIFDCSVTEVPSYRDVSYKVYILVKKDGETMLITDSGKTIKSLGKGVTDVKKVGDELFVRMNREYVPINNDRDKAKVIKSNLFQRLCAYTKSSSEYNRFGNGEIIETTITVDNNGNVWESIPLDYNGREILHHDGKCMIVYNLEPTNNIIYNDVDFYKKSGYLFFRKSDGGTDIWSIEDGKIIANSDKYIIDYCPNISVYENIFVYYDSKDAYDNKASFGLMRTDGTPITDCIIDDGEYWDNNNKYFIAKANGKKGLFSASGEVVFPIEYEEIEMYSDYNIHQFLVSKEGSTALYDAKEQKFIVPLGKYSQIGESVRGATFVAKDGKWGVVAWGSEIIKPIYNEGEIKIGNEYGELEGLTIHIVKDGKISVVNFAGKTIIPLGRYDGIKGYQLGFVLVKKGNKVGLCDVETGKEIVPPTFDAILACGNGKILVSTETDNGAIYSVYDKNGRFITKQSFSHSQINSLSRFMNDYLGSLIYTFD